MSPEWMFELGRRIARVESRSERIDLLTEDMRETRKGLEELRHLVHRVGWLLTLFASGFALILSNEPAAEAILKLVKLYKGIGG